MEAIIVWIGVIAVIRYAIGKSKNNVGVCHSTGISIVSVQPLIAFNTGYPHNHVIRSVC
jgi:hypothetical protein